MLENKIQLLVGVIHIPDVISLLEQFASSGAYDRMDEASIYFGKRVKYLRRLRNLTQAQLAEKLRLSVKYVSQIETGIAPMKAGQ